MNLNCGIVGLPNVGKSTLFSALTAQMVLSANYPFATIDPNVGIVPVPDLRVEQIAQLVETKKIILAHMEFVDIAGLVKGASTGEGLGNRFLSHIRNVDLIVHVLRCFEDKDIIHVSNKVDPLADLQVIQYELCLADLETVEKRIQKIKKQIQSQNDLKQKQYLLLLEQIAKNLNEGKLIYHLGLQAEELDLLKDLCLITQKPYVFVCNVNDQQDNVYVEQVKKHAQQANIPIVILQAQLQSELSQLELEDKKEFMEAMDVSETSLGALARICYDELNLITFFTVGPEEIHAWTITKGQTAPEAAGVIHSDFQRGFIRAEVYSVDDLIQFQSEANIRAQGKLRSEGKQYIMQDGDIVHFRFNV